MIDRLQAELTTYPGYQPLAGSDRRELLPVSARRKQEAFCCVQSHQPPHLGSGVSYAAAGEKSPVPHNREKFDLCLYVLLLKGKKVLIREMFYLKVTVGLKELNSVIWGSVRQSCYSLKYWRIDMEIVMPLIIKVKRLELIFTEKSWCEIIASAGDVNFCNINVGA